MDLKDRSFDVDAHYMDSVLADISKAVQDSIPTNMTQIYDDLRDVCDEISKRFASDFTSQYAAFSRQALKSLSPKVQAFYKALLENVANGVLYKDITVTSTTDGININIPNATALAIAVLEYGSSVTPPMPNWRAYKRSLMIKGGEVVQDAIIAKLQKRLDQLEQKYKDSKYKARKVI